MARRTKAEANQTRLKILKAALDLFVAKGYEETTFEDVAQRIRLSKGAVYWHFKTKPDLLAELIVHVSAMNFNPVSQTLPGPISLAGLVEHFAGQARLIAIKPTYGKFFRMMMNLNWTAEKFAPLKFRLQQIESDFFLGIRKTLSALQKKGEVSADADIAAMSLVLGALWIGFMKLQVDQCIKMDFSKAIGLGFDTVISAIKA